MSFFKSAKRLKTKAKTRKQPFGASLRLTVESLESRWVPAGLPTHEGFVSQAYLDLLHRPVDPTGLSAWSGALDQGATRTQVASGIDNSLEFRTDFVQSTYQTLLHRSAETGGLEAWLGGIAGGATLEQIEAGIAGSTEYFQNHGSTNTGFLNGIYHDALGRAVDPVGASVFGPALDAGADRTTIALDIYTSLEFRQDLVNSYYVQFLHRNAEQAGLDGWVADLQAGQRDEDVIAGIVGSQEYLIRGAAAPSTPALSNSSDSATKGDGITNINTPTFTGTAESGTTVNILANGVQVGTGTATIDGFYQIQTSTLADATYSITATAVNEIGPVSSPSGASSVTIDTVAPGAPTITNPSGTVNVGSDTSIAIAGTAEANSLVQIFNDANANHVLDASDPLAGSQQLTGGSTSFSISVALTSHTTNNFLATATDAAGNQSAAAAVPPIKTGLPTPVVTPPANQTGTEGDLIASGSVVVTASDGQGSVLTFGASGLPQGLSIDPSTGVISGTLGLQSGGSHLVTVTAANADSTGSNTFTWTVADPTVPVVTSPGDQTNTQNDVVAGLTVTASDADNDPLTFSATGLPGGLSINASTGVISGTITAAGPFNVTVSASDGVNTGTASFAWQVTPSSHPVTVTNPGPQTGNEGSPASLQISATAMSGNPLTFTATGLPGGLHIDPFTGLISGTLNGQSAGTATVTVSATDGTDTGSATFNWTVADVTTPVVGSLLDQQNSEGDTLSTDIGNVVNVAGGAFDNDGDTLTFGANGLPPGLSIDATTGDITGTFTGQSAGSYVVTITATDGFNTGSSTFNWTVQDITTPVVTAPANQGSNEGDVVTSVQASATDDDGDTLTFSAQNLPAGLSIDPATGIISGTIQAGATANSPYTVTIMASDGFSMGSASFTWLVDNGSIPSVTAPANQMNFEGDPVSGVTVTASNAGDPNPLTFAASNLPAGLSINATTGEITGTLTLQSGNVNAGQYIVTVSATNGVNTGSATFNWMVTDTTVPVVTAPVDQTNNIGDVVTGVQVTATDDDGDPLTFSASSLPAGLSIDPSTGVISGTPTTPGVFSVTVGASDGQNQGFSSFNWNIVDTTIPVVTAPANQANNEGDVIAGLTVTATDPDNTTFTFSADNLPPGLSIDPTTGVISGTIAAGAKFAGSPFTVTVSASDGQNIGQAQFTWIVDDNTIPVVGSPGDQVNFEGDATPLIDVFAPASDPDGVDVPVISATGLPPGLSINSTSGEITGQLTNQSAGMYTVTVSAFDGVNTGTNTFHWTVIDSTTPVVTAPADQASNEGATVAGVMVTATDADNDPLTFSAQGLPAGLTVDPNTGEISGTVQPGASAGSPYFVTVTASDGNNEGSANFMWRIDNGTAPVVTQPLDQANNEGDTVALAVTASDSDGDPLTFSAQNLPPGLSIDANGNITGTLTGVSAGTYLVTVSASDGLNSGSAVFNWTVTDATTPAVGQPAAQTNNEGDTVNLTVTAADTDNDPLTFSASGLPTGLSIDASSGAITGTIAAGANAGSPYTVMVSVSDGHNTGTTTFFWLVNNSNSPVVTTLGDQTNNEGDPVSGLVMTASNPSGNPVTFTAANLPTGLSIDLNSGQISGTIDALAAGTYQVVITATDTVTGNFGSATFKWVVNDVSIPLITSPGDQLNIEGDQVVAVFVSASDPDGETITFSANNLPPGLKIDATSGEITGTVATGAASGSPYVVDVFANDGFNTVSAQFTWTISA